MSLDSINTIIDNPNAISSETAENFEDVLAKSHAVDFNPIGPVAPIAPFTPLQIGLPESGPFTFEEIQNAIYELENPDVKAAVEQNLFPSGLAHYASSGATENRTIYVFNEGVYLLNNPDVAAAVSAGLFSSGLEHFLASGFAEGRGTVGDVFILFREQTYLANNPDVAETIGVSFNSGLDHFVQFGIAEGRIAA